MHVGINIIFTPRNCDRKENFTQFRTIEKRILTQANDQIRNN